MTSNVASLEQTLASVPPMQWKVSKAIILDWHDGPREGVCELSAPRCCFFFQLFAEEAHPEEGLALFMLSEMPLASVDQLALTLAELGERKGLVWIPIWRFNDQSSQIKVEQDVDRLLATARPTNIVISTNDMERFTGCWHRVR